jgi:hypothetical protein
MGIFYHENDYPRTGSGEIAGVVCTLMAMAGLEEYCALEWRGTGLVLEDPKV